MGTDAREVWVIVLGAVCVLSVALALVWRLRMVSRQATGAHGARRRCGHAPQAPVAPRADGKGRVVVSRADTLPETARYRILGHPFRPGRPPRHARPRPAPDLARPAADRQAFLAELETSSTHGPWGSRVPGHSELAVALPRDTAAPSSSTQWRGSRTSDKDKLLLLRPPRAGRRTSRRCFRSPPGHGVRAQWPGARRGALASAMLDAPGTARTRRCPSCWCARRIASSREEAGPGPDGSRPACPRRCSARRRERL